MLNHPVTGLTNASKWKHEDLMVEVEHERHLALCSSPVREALRSSSVREVIWSALLISMRTEWRSPGARNVTDRSLARAGR